MECVQFQRVFNELYYFRKIYELFPFLFRINKYIPALNMPAYLKTQQWQLVFIIAILNKKKKIANILWIHDIEFFISNKLLYPLIKVLAKEMLYMNLEHWKYSMLLNKLCQSGQDKYISNYCEYFRNKPFLSVIHTFVISLIMLFMFRNISE